MDTEKINIIRNNILSIGNCCYYCKYKKDYLKKNKLESSITNFFDWIVCQPNDMINIIQCNNIDKE